LTYFGLGSDAPVAAPAYLRSYYAFLGPIADVVAAAAPTDPDAVRGLAAAFAQTGADELIFLPTSAGAEQLDLLADAVDAYLAPNASGKAQRAKREQHAQAGPA